MGQQISYDSFRQGLIEAVKAYITSSNKSIADFYVASYLTDGVCTQARWEKQLNINPERKTALNIILTVIRFLDASSESTKTLSSENKTHILLALVCLVRGKIWNSYKVHGVADLLASIWTDVTQSKLFTNLDRILPEKYRALSVERLLLSTEYSLLRDFLISLPSGDHFISSKDAQAFLNDFNLSCLSRPVTPEEKLEQNDYGLKAAKAISPAQVGLFGRRRSTSWNSDTPTPGTSPECDTADLVRINELDSQTSPIS